MNLYQRTAKSPVLVVTAVIMFSLILALARIASAGQSHSYQAFSELSARLPAISKKIEKVFFGSGIEAKETQRSVVKAIVKEDAGGSAPQGAADTGNKSKAVTAANTDLPVEPLPAGAARIRVGSTGDFVAKTGGGTTRDFGKANLPAAGYWEKKYFLVEGDKTLAVSSEPIRFEPQGPGTVLLLPDYADMNWNNAVNLNLFRGAIEIAYSSKSNQLWAVNELYLEDYLRGIAEAAHDSPEEHLKVMAIVSRSYAVHHLANGGRHPGEPFHLKNSRNGNGDDQVYRGYMAEVRQPRIAQAAADTAGTVVTYNGDPVITPYSSNAGGRTLSPAEAGWNVDWPWCISVPDPDTAGMAREGHGVGLSGYGSRKKAERGESAGQILTYYFPGTALGQTDTNSKLVRVAIFGKPL